MPVRFRRVRGKQETAPEAATGENGRRAEAAPSDEEEAPADEAELEEGTDEEQEEADAPVEEPERPEPPKPKAPAGGSSLDIENALKELAARMTVLNSSVEGVKESRHEMEEKLGAVEERMMRLGALAEAVSSKYNPFLAENSPSEPSWKQAEAEAGAGEPSAPASPEPQGPSIIGDVDLQPSSSEAATSAERPTPPTPIAQPGPAREDRPSPPSLELPEAAEALAPRRPRSPDEHASAPGSGAGPRPPATAQDRFEQNMLLLEWVGLMLRRVGRAGLLDLLDYYEGLGWLDIELKDRALRVAVGVDAPDRAGDGDWRGDLDLHERSLVAVERLQGRNVSAARLEGLRMDLRRIFGG